MLVEEGVVQAADAAAAVHAPRVEADDVEPLQPEAALDVVAAVGDEVEAGPAGAARVEQDRADAAPLCRLAHEGKVDAVAVRVVVVQRHGERGALQVRVAVGGFVVARPPGDRPGVGHGRPGRVGGDRRVVRPGGVGGGGRGGGPLVGATLLGTHPRGAHAAVVAAGRHRQRRHCQADHRHPSPHGLTVAKRGATIRSAPPALGRGGVAQTARPRNLRNSVCRSSPSPPSTLAPNTPGWRIIASIGLRPE